MVAIWERTIINVTVITCLPTTTRLSSRPLAPQLSKLADLVESNAVSTNTKTLGIIFKATESAIPIFKAFKGFRFQH